MTSKNGVGQETVPPTETSKASTTLPRQPKTIDISPQAVPPNPSSIYSFPIAEGVVVHHTHSDWRHEKMNMVRRFPTPPLISMVIPVAKLETSSEASQESNSEELWKPQKQPKWKTRRITPKQRSVKKPPTRTYSTKPRPESPSWQPRAQSSKKPPVPPFLEKPEKLPKPAISQEDRTDKEWVSAIASVNERLRKLLVQHEDPRYLGKVHRTLVNTPRKSLQEVNFFPALCQRTGSHELASLSYEMIVNKVLKACNEPWESQKEKQAYVEYCEYLLERLIWHI